ncbi:hypothetical protein [Pseudothauera rhizosphaerae]|uniref:NadR/Ttd14 AAA domain-containing protein n=1 Tax=Pseudothauera rhizosphaerae TaxID=2565932 RepID=A0A4S4AVU3_9RHOO|nr:hypothetical protein [Pseudothauera rhizosphaerae]THF64140.1 hypothetical protein E6O51_02105 [Pseudothauera rhizosphaerae]
MEATDQMHALGSMTLRNLEFIGPSGVGKTTLASLAVNHLPPCWITKKQAKFFLEGFTENITQTEHEAAFLRALLDAKDKSITRSFSSDIHKRKKLMDFFRAELLLDHAILSVLENYRVFSDDGISHNFGVELLAYSDDTGLQSFFSRRDIVHLTASAETILDHLKKRNEQSPNALNDWYGYYHGNLEALTEIVCSSIRRSIETSKLAERFGSRVLQLNAGEGLDANKQRVLEFIE